MRRPKGWNAVVLASAALIGTAILLAGVWWLVSLQSGTTSYAVTASLTGVDLQLSSGEASIVGSSSPALQVRRTDSYAFGHPARERRWVAGGVLHIVSRCPRIVLGSCSASYELAVPQGVAVQVHTRSGAIRMNGFNGDASVGTRSGNVDIEAYCGFHLSASSESGSLYVSTACAPQSLRLQTASGDAVALVPPGRYRIGAISGARRQRVTGVRNDPTAPFTVDVGSASGAVAVEGGL
jgi:hypothetical protein